MGTRQAAGDLHPETPTKPPPNPPGISPAQQVDTASGRGLTPRNPHQTPTKPPWNQSRPTSGHGKRQGTYTQKPAENLHQTPMESVPPNKWTRQAAGDLHPETPTKPPPNPHGISPAQQVDTASGRGLTPRNLQKTCRKPPWN